MSQTGSYFARRGARILCLAEGGFIPIPLVTAARAAGGGVHIIADETIVMPPALSSVPIEVIAGRNDRFARIAALADAYIGLPGSLASTSGLFGSWTAAKAAGRHSPIVLLNRNRAYDVLRGYAADVLSPGLPGYERLVQFTDNVEDLWPRASRLINEGH